MFSIRRSQDRGHSQFDWLTSYHTFSFASYHDPRYMGFSALRVINDDTVAPSRGFDTHGHSDMEIVSIVLSGALNHKDSLGNGSTIRPGDIQRMSAGTGVLHSEFNPSPSEPVHFLQIWIIPALKGIEPGYEQRAFTLNERQGKLCLVASATGHNGSVTVHQDVNLYWTTLKENEGVTYQPVANRNTYVHVATGSVQINDQSLIEGDGVAVAKQILETEDTNKPYSALYLRGIRTSDVLIFDLP